VFIRRVVINNIKGFERVDLDFAPDGKNYAGWCVVTGDNGSGKTALLKAIALAILGPEQRRGLIPDLSGWVTQGHENGTISVEVLPDHDYDKTARGGFPSQSTFWAEVEVRQDDAGAWEAVSADIFRQKKKSAVNGPWAEATPGWCCLAYGPFRRLYGSSPDAQRLMFLPGRIPHFATLFKEDATLGEGEEWVRELQYKHLEGKVKEGRILDSLLEFVRGEFLRHGVSISKVDSDGIWLSDTANREIPLTDMSEGYRSALAMLIDIFRHMVSIYGPDVLGQDEQGRTVVDRPGVVLIDEIDVHLHPDWQRSVGFWLQEHFPSVQFIVTTHSPLVCPAANHGRIYHLPDRAVESEEDPFRLSASDYDRVRAGKPDQILVSPAFGMPYIRSPLAVRARERHALLVAKRTGPGLSDNEIEELDQLDLFCGPRGITYSGAVASSFAARYAACPSLEVRALHLARRSTACLGCVSWFDFGEGFAQRTGGDGGRNPALLLLRRFPRSRGGTLFAYLTRLRHYVRVAEPAACIGTVQPPEERGTHVAGCHSTLPRPDDRRSMGSLRPRHSLRHDRCSPHA